MKPIEGLVFLKIITKNLRIGLKSKAMKLEQKKSFELMLSKPLKTLSDVEEFCAKKTSNILADLKYDGERTLLIYEKGAGIELISRRNKPQTDIYKKLVSDLNN